MARERFVTRSVAVTTFTVMTVNTSTREVSDVTVDVPSACNLKDKEVDRIITAQLPLDCIMVTKTQTAIKEVIYGIPEADFIKLAKVMPPRTKAETE